jgi:CBS domain-containing protein
MRKNLKASDIMQRDVVTVGPNDTLREAMTLLIENQISGLPVLDNKDRCVGVITATDILSLEHEQAEGADDEFEERMGSYFDPDAQRWENVRLGGAADQLPQLAVGEVMSRNVVSVLPQAKIEEVARIMAEKRIHRVLVKDREEFLHGVISALDFVRLFAEP